ncbi:MAG: D-inositol-3-phosphate glycosyltransferase [Thermoanaerobaculia bacterium]|nr:D-inositol-3-phosphate glycosyltransferase [Thermoanaerobaculia bacterium]
MREMQPAAPTEDELSRELSSILDRFPLRRDVIVFAPSIGWDPPFLFQRPHQLARAFARAGCLVFFVEPDYPARRPLGFHQDVDGLFVSCVPLQVLSSLSSPVVVVFPYNTEAIRCFREPRVFYEFLDDLELWGASPELAASHRLTLARAALVTATARNLLSKISKWRPDALYSPNAADFEHFAPRPSRRPLPGDLGDILRPGAPVIGYSGALANWFDFELLASVSKLLPNMLFVLVGTDHDGSLEKSRLLSRPNVHWLGPKPYEGLPDYIEHFDVATIPFRVNEVTASTNPVKLFEYFAAEKPVVSTALPECLAIPLVHCGRSAEEFAALLQTALSQKDDARFRSSASSLAREQTWDARAGEILHALGEPASPLAADWRIHELCSSLSRAEREIDLLTLAASAPSARASGPPAEHERRALEQERTIQQLTISLNSITSSRGWRALQKIWDLRLAVAPRGSRRERVFQRALSRLGMGKKEVAALAASTQRTEPPREPAAPAVETPVVSTPAPEAPPPVPGPLHSISTRGSAPHRSESRRQPVKMARPRVAYLTNQLLDLTTKEPRFGGGERYCLTLASLLKSLGFDVTFFQASNEPFEGDYYGNPVIGIPMGAWYSEFQFGICSAFYDLASRYDRVIHNLAEYASGRMWPDAILICHGIWFDHDNYGTFRTEEWYRNLNLAFSQPGHVVSVDTNTINVVRSLWPELAPKMTYIPNWVDVSKFHPADGQAESKVVLFPRRSQVNRGSRILGEILKAVPHQDWKFRWVGEGDAVDTQLIKDLTKREPRLEYHSASFEEMPRHYQSADICVIPTIACEGTSLSCLEALASGNAVISTNVGGLPDLVQPGNNGLLVDPTPEAIAEAITFCIENPGERARLRAKGVESAQYFRHEVWQERWTAFLKRAGWLSNRTGRPE